MSVATSVALMLSTRRSCSAGDRRLRRALGRLKPCAQGKLGRLARPAPRPAGSDRPAALVVVATTPGPDVDGAMSPKSRAIATAPWSSQCRPKGAIRADSKRALHLKSPGPAGSTSASSARDSGTALRASLLSLRRGTRNRLVVLLSRGRHLQGPDWRGRRTRLGLLYAPPVSPRWEEWGLISHSGLGASDVNSKVNIGYRHFLPAYAFPISNTTFFLVLFFFFFRRAHLVDSSCYRGPAQTRPDMHRPNTASLATAVTPPTPCRASPGIITGARLLSRGAPRGRGRRGRRWPIPTSASGLYSAGASVRASGSVPECSCRAGAASWLRSIERGKRLAGEGHPTTSKPSRLPLIVPCSGCHDGSASPLRADRAARSPRPSSARTERAANETRGTESDWRTLSLREKVPFDQGHADHVRYDLKARSRRAPAPSSSTGQSVQEP